LLELDGDLTPAGHLGAILLTSRSGCTSSRQPETNAPRAIGANDLQATKALLEADAWPGPSLVIAYSTCIAHGIDMAKSMSHQKDAVRSGYWPLYRLRPSEAEHGIPCQLDSKEPSMPIADFVANEARDAVLARTHPDRAERLLQLTQADVDERWR
jgi:pyruvate-ferredoxin/flavodoxin oxidoreductase